MTEVARLVDVSKQYLGETPHLALRAVSATFHAGERVAIVGRSGAGKSTLLNVLGLLDTQTAGTYFLLGQETASVKTSRRDTLRAQHLGFIFQDHHVLGHRTVLENLMLRLAIVGTPRPLRAEIACAALQQVDLIERKDALARLLSGGEKQRLAIARAVVSQPSLLLADEPTGNLDTKNMQVVLGIFDQVSARGVCVIVITHDERVSQWADRSLVLADGVLRERSVA